MRQPDDVATPVEAVFGLVVATTGQAPRSTARIVGGNDNEVYRVLTGGGDRLFVRIRQFGEQCLEEEAWAMEQARRAGVPVPAVYAVETVRLAGRDREAMVLAEAGGTPLSTLIRALDTRDLATALVDVGATLRALHSVRVEGFYCRRRGRWDFPDWQSLAASMVEGRAGERGELRAAGFREGEIEFMLRMITRYGELFASPQPVLCHGDYAPGHIFVGNDLKVSAVIDFGMFQGGPPIVDFTHDVIHPGFDLGYVREGYGGAWATSDEFERELALSRLNSQIGHLAHNIRRGDTAAASRVRDALAETVAALHRLE